MVTVGVEGLMHKCIIMYITDLGYRLHFLHYFEENKLIRQLSTRQKADFHTYTVQSEIGKGL